eukprot:m.447355 g.447355  ORF g.447355 m.447355 type:complete len:286 (+) comp20315_c3_seq3:1505-2362(+)
MAETSNAAAATAAAASGLEQQVAALKLEAQDKPETSPPQQQAQQPQQPQTTATQQPQQPQLQPPPQQEERQLEKQGVTNAQAPPTASLGAPTLQKQRLSPLKHATGEQTPRPPPAPGMAYRRRRTGPKNSTGQARSQLAKQTQPQVAPPTGQGQSPRTRLDGQESPRATKVQSSLAPSEPKASLQAPAAGAVQPKPADALLAARVAMLCSPASSAFLNQPLPNTSMQTGGGHVSALAAVRQGLALSLDDAAMTQTNKPRADPFGDMTPARVVLAQPVPSPADKQR